MADYHILSADQFGNSFRVVFHIPVPDQNNEVAYSYRTAIVEWQGGAENISSLVPFIAGAELTQMQSGEVYEVSRGFNSNPNETLTQKRDKLDLMFAAVKTEAQADFQDRLGYWGYDRDVP